jgi:ABC-type polysaccharide/polyol phosphate transport system ATPase subunit
VDWAVELRGVSKGFVLRRNPARNIKVRLIGMFDPRYREQLERFWALGGVDLLVRKGEWLGIIGPADRG